MVDNAIQTNWNVTFYTKGTYNCLVTCKNYNKKNNFGILKKMCTKFFIKSNLNVLFLLYVVICCHMLHDMMLNGNDEDVDELMLQLKVNNVPKNKKVVEKKNSDPGVWGDEMNEPDVEFAL